ncbi:MAG: Stp1/IreP family PP2C-type Ser/Thr phosphatase [Chromatiales bacterium]|nr:Stp1/IreP family PP2C-type Ser/Thr phosphatase [Chromatiales bacterium]
MSAWKMVGLTDTGRVREHNEDAIAWNAEQGWAVVADGMGGHHAGEVASAIAVETIGEMLRQSRASQMLQRAIEQANLQIYAHATSDPEIHTMGTTVVALALEEGRLHYAHVGDSRLYRLRDGELTQLTRDHSLVQELVDEGMLEAEQARNSPQKNVITRALGLDSGVAVDLGDEAVVDDDCYLLCSDGLSNYLMDEEIATLLAGDALPEVVRALVDAANERGGDDNISVIVVRIW